MQTLRLLQNIKDNSSIFTLKSVFSIPPLNKILARTRLQYRSMFHRVPFHLDEVQQLYVELVAGRLVCVRKYVTYPICLYSSSVALNGREGDHRQMKCLFWDSFYVALRIISLLFLYILCMLADFIIW